MNKGLNINEIMEILPHRYPFLLIDKIADIEPGKKAIGYKNVTMNEYFFQGHFPQEPVMPGVLIIEALAQVGAVAVLSLEEFKGKTAYFAGINKARFRRKVVPGDTLKLEVELIKLKGVAGIASAIATVNGEKAAEAEIMVMIG
ncbi:3-hydroxyacyl-ACP dehydratase FabZ [Clostridium sp. MSJ-11]|uniref:3-hydroxyacyl-[acyl-carrier-protein] dehydratase FabZ n=1 Tax=Clostridium mobile TaxID=2841512 RepID=A0ABS6EM95_9CLOT|nr:3-hydroxyacyl-ACP dehydratase FabZ [Clostridium mobile]MBU5486351.1 3-hydroxyacyl-ACP dehydratase FabZ [Clostridium mobile]